MASTRQSKRTPSRTSSLSRDPDADRAASGARKTSRSNLFDDDDFFMKPFKKFSVDNSDHLPTKSSELSEKIRKVTRGFETSTLPTYEPRTELEKTEISFKKDVDARGKPIIMKEELKYTVPDTSKTFRRSSITESSTFDTKPLLESTLRTRRTSLGSGEDTGPRSSVRVRKFSEESSSSCLPPRPMRNTSIEESKFQSSQSMRDARKLKNSDELSESIHKMVNKMKSNHLEDDTDVLDTTRAFRRSLRAASLDPFEDDFPAISRGRPRSRMNKLTYGVGGH